MSEATPASKTNPQAMQAIRQRLQDQQVAQLKSGSVVKPLTPMETMVMLRSEDASYPTSWEQRFKQLFLEAFPEAKENVDKFQTSPGCGCRKSLQTIIALKHTEVTAILEKVYDSKIYDVTDVQSTVPTTMAARSGQVSAVELSGKGLLLDPTVDAYSRHMAKLNRNGIRQYNGVSVVPTTDEAGAAKWAVLFW